MRALAIIFTLFLASCGADSNNGTSTDVTISLGQSIAAGAIGAQGSIPDSIQSVSVEALNAAGKVIAGPIIANRPNFTVKIRVPNGKGIRFRILAFDTKDAQGIVLYETLSAPVDLKGKPIAVPVKMSLSVAVIANKTTVFRNGTVNLIGKVSGNTPKASSPLIWDDAGAGTFTTTDANGAARTWQAPNTPNTYTIAAYINPDVNPDQDPTVKGSVQIEVVNRAPVISNFAGSTFNITAGTASSGVLFNVADADGDTITIASVNQPSWAVLTRSGTNPATVTLALSPPANISGLFTFPIGISDGFGAKLTKNISINVAAGSATAAPNIVVNNILNVIDALNPTVISDAHLSTTDADTLPTNLVYTVTSLPTQGTVKLDGVTLPSNQFSQLDLQEGIVTYTPNANASGPDSFDFTVSDSVNIVNGTFNIALNFGTAKTTINNLTLNTTNGNCNTTWTISNSPYLVTSGITGLQVASGCSLTIEAGVIVKFQPDAIFPGRIDVNGTLNVNGTLANPVYFTSYKDDSIGGDTNGDGITSLPSANDWSGLSFFGINNSTESNGSVNGLEIRYANRGLTVQNASPTFFDLTIRDSNLRSIEIPTTTGQTTNPTFSNLTIVGDPIVHISMSATNGILMPTFSGGTVTKLNTGGRAIGITGAAANPTLNGLIVNSAGLGVGIETGAQATIDFCIIRGGTAEGIRIGKTGAGNASGSVTIKNSNIMNNAQGIIINATSQAAIQHNIIRGNMNEGIIVGALNQTANAIKIQNNLIGGNGVGINVIAPTNATHATIQHNTFGGNTGPGLLADLYANISLDYNIFSGPSSPSNISSSSASVSANYNLSTDNIIPLGTGNIPAADPLFANGFYLDPTSSPAINIAPGSVTYLANHAFAQTNTQDTSGVDLGYHHADPAPTVGSANSTVVVTTLLPVSPFGLVEIIITPKAVSGDFLSAGLDVTASRAGDPGIGSGQLGILSPVIDLGDGTYKVIFTAGGGTPGLPEANIISVNVNGTQLNTQPQIVWQ